MNTLQYFCHFWLSRHQTQLIKIDKIMPQVVKAIILGKQAVGKSSILLKCIQGVFGVSHQATVGVDFKAYDFQYKTQQYILQIWDTAGQQKYRSIASHYYKKSHIVFLVVEAPDGPQKNMEQIAVSLKHYREHGNAQFIYVFVNKTDLVEEQELKEQWKEQEQLVNKIKNELGIKQIYYVSAKNTPKEEFETHIKYACRSYVESDKGQTLPSAISGGLSLSPKKKAFSKKQSGQLLQPKKKKCC